MKNILFLVPFLLGFLYSELRAQDTFVHMNKTVADLNLELNWNKKVEPPLSTIEGSPYLNEEFQKGEVYFDGKFKVTDIPLRYNVYNDEMEYLVKGTVMAIAFPEKIDTVFIEEETFIYLKEDGKNITEGYVKKWNEGYPSVLTKIKVNYFEKEPPKAIVESKPARFEPGYNEQFLMKSPMEIESIKSVKKLIESLGDFENELTDYAKKERISSKNGAELAKLIDYYRSLQ